MKDENDIVATAATDVPEILDADSLDAATGGVEYGGTNTCEPVKPTGGNWINLLSVSSGTLFVKDRRRPSLKAGG